MGKTYKITLRGLSWELNCRAREAPEIEVVLLNRPGSPFLGVGEGAMGPAPAAIANAIYDAVGVSMRTIPFTPERVKAALDEIG